MRGLDGEPKSMRSPESAGRDTPCPFYGARHHAEETTKGSPALHVEEKEPNCSLCESRGEFLGDVDTFDRGRYAQYRCRGCGHGFMVRKADGDDALPAQNPCRTSQEDEE